MMKYVLSFSALMLSAILFGCSDALSLAQLYTRLNEKCPPPKSQCTVNLSELTDFEWDQVVFVKMTATTTLIAAEIGVQIEKREFEDLIVFLNDQKIAVIYKRKYHPEKPFSQTVFLDFSTNPARYQVIDRSKAVFRAERVGRSGENFVLFDTSSES